MAREFLLNFGQLHYYATKGYEWAEIGEELVEVRERPPASARPPAPVEPDDEDFSEMSWIRGDR